MLFRNNWKFSNWQNGFTTCFKVVLFILLLNTFSPVFAQTPTTPPPAENSEDSDSIDVIGISSKEMGTTLMDTAQLRALKDTLRWKLNQFFDIDMLEKCLEVRSISNLSGLSLLSKNKSLSDTVNLFEKNYETNIYINSFVNSGQLWPRLIFNPNKTTNYIADAKNKPAIGFDIRFTPKGTIGNRVFYVDIQNHATDGILDSTKQKILKDVTNQSLINKQLTNIKPYGRDTVNNAMYKGFASLRGMFAQKISQNNISQVTFEPCINQGYGFDVLPHEAIQSSYDVIDVNGRNYNVPWKSVSTAAGDSVKVTVNLSNKNAANHVVKFRSPITTMVVKPTGTNTYVISIPGGIGNSEQAIEAYYVDSTISEVPKEFIIGKLKIHSYAPITKKLTPVILNGASFSIDKSELEKYLNNIYKQSAVTWIVNDPIYKTVKNWDMDDDKTIFLTTPYSHYSDEMQTIIDGIVDTPDPEINYIIITDIQNIYNYTECMPLKSQFGFLFTKNLGTVNEGAGSGNKGYHMIAHELGHGAFSLKHIEDDYKILDASDNLMNNYTMGKAFWKPQWDAIQNSIYAKYENVLTNNQKINNNDSLKNDTKEIVFVYDDQEYKKLSDSSYPDLFINEGDNSEKFEIKLKNNDFISKATKIIWDGAIGDRDSVRIDPVNIPENGQTIKVKIDNSVAVLNIKKRKEFIKINHCDNYFAPSIENLDISYNFLIKTSKISSAKVEIFTKSDLINPIYVDSTITTIAENTIHWNGKINHGKRIGNYISIFDSPYTVKISGSFASSSSVVKLSDSRKVMVELESISITPNDTFSMVKPNKTAIEIDKEIEALIKVKSKQNQGVITSLPFKINWSFEDPDDNSNNIAIDVNGSAGNDNTLVANGGKADINSIMWKSTSDYTSVVNKTTAQSDVVTSGINTGKTKILFSSSVIAGDNYKLVAQIKDSIGSIIKEQKTGIGTVRKKVHFDNIYQMANSFDMKQMMSVNNINAAFSGDGSTDYSLKTSSVTILSSANSPHFLVSLLPPIPLVDSITRLPNPKTELPTAQELQNYNHGNSIQKHIADSIIRLKAQKWFNRNNYSLSRSINNFVHQANINTPAIIGALYYHPKLDGDPSTGQTNYYPSGIQINVANGNNTAILVDPDNDWRYVQGFEDNSGNTWLFLNITSTLRQQIVARHEVGHASDHENFGNGDHATQGLMHFSADMVRVPPDGDADFSDESLNKLRGRK